MDFLGFIFGMVVVIGLLYWTFWPVIEFADVNRLTGWEAFGFGAGIWITVFILSLVVCCAYHWFANDGISSVARTANGELQGNRTMNTTWSFQTSRTNEDIGAEEQALISNHMVNGNKVLAYHDVKVRDKFFRFALVAWPQENIRIYVLKSPSYGGREQGAHPTHRYYDPDFKCHYICIDDQYWPHGKDLEHIMYAKEFTDQWSEATEEYIRTGKRFN